ncbi:MAG TPA: glycine oxidase ThiO [Pyrinomonadaceae bacterium]|nr:glycine oxidase ThiO [Pyrinomonadaceae bacterium]
MASLNTEILIIGGGVIGLSIARALYKRGVREITVIDKGRVGGEASWAAAGMLAPNAETHQADAFFRFCTASNTLYPDFAAELLDETGIDVELDRSGTLYLAFDEAEKAAIDKKYKWQKTAGIEVASLSSEEVLALEPMVSPEVIAGLFYPSDWQVENRKLITALRRYAELNGINVIENSPVSELIVNHNRVVGAITADAKINAGATILTAGAWTSGLLPNKFEIKPIRGQMISFDAPERPLNCVIYSPRGYVVPRADGRVLAGATVEDAGFNKEVTADAITSLRDAALEISPVFANFDIKGSWCGLRPAAADELPVIGRPAGIDGLMLATGHYRNGILLAPITAQMVADEVALGITSEYFREFSPDRFAKAGTATP